MSRKEYLDIPEELFVARLQAQKDFFGFAHRVHHGSNPSEVEEAIEGFDGAFESLTNLFPKINLDPLRKLKEESHAAKVVTTLNIYARSASDIARCLRAIDRLGFTTFHKVTLDIGRHHYSWALKEQEFK